MIACGGSATCFARPSTAPAAASVVDPYQYVAPGAPGHERRNSSCLAGPATAAAAAAAAAARVGVVTADGESPVAVAPFPLAPPSTMALSPRNRPRLQLTPREHVARQREQAVLMQAAV